MTTKNLCSFVELSLSLYAFFRSRNSLAAKNGGKKLNLISGFIYRKSAMLARKIKLYTRRVNDTIGNSITHAMCMFIVYPFALVCRGIGAITHSSLHGYGSAFMLN